jgi:galactokinase
VDAVGAGNGDVVVARAPGRVNLIGDHTDYTGGLVLPMAIDRWTEVSGRRGGDAIELVSDAEVTPARVRLPVTETSKVEPAWARYVAAVAAELGASVGLAGRVTSAVPTGNGLSSSAALEVATALALGGPRHDPLALAQLCQRAEHRATGVPTGIMDQLASAAARAGHALLLDCHALTWAPRTPSGPRSALEPKTRSGRCGGRRRPTSRRSRT